MSGYVQDLNVAKPSDNDAVADGAKEIRDVKSSLKKTFPRANSALDVSNDSINTAIQTDIPALQQAVTDLGGSDGYHGNVASAYWNPDFGAGSAGVVYEYNVASVTDDGNGVTRVTYKTMLDGISNSNEATGQYAVNITPVTLTGKPVIIVLYGSVRSHLIFKSYQLENDMTTWTEMAGATCSFHLTVVDMTDGQ